MTEAEECFKAIQEAVKNRQYGKIQNIIAQYGGEGDIRYYYDLYLECPYGSEWKSIYLDPVEDAVFEAMGISGYGIVEGNCEGDWAQLTIDTGGDYDPNLENVPGVTVEIPNLAKFVNNYNGNNDVEASIAPSFECGGIDFDDGSEIKGYRLTQWLNAN